MSFEDLPAMPPMLHPDAAGYADRVLAASRLAVAQCRTVLDISYGDDYWQKLDVYLPPDGAPARAPVPVLVYVHGGAWSNGCKEWMGFLAPALVDTPMIFVSISHRRSPDVRMPEIVADCFDALAWVHRNIAALGGDPHALYVGGHSAGAHLAALLALRTDLLQASGIAPSDIQACFPTSGTFDFRTLDPAAGAVEARVVNTILPRPEDAWEWSPLRYLGNSAVPFYVTWGERDFPRVVAQGRAFVAAAASTPGRVRWSESRGLGHFTVNEAAGLRDGEWSSTVRSIVRAQPGRLQGRTP
jgi:arylformamidase